MSLPKEEKISNISLTPSTVYKMLSLKNNTWKFVKFIGHSTPDFLYDYVDWKKDGTENPMKTTNMYDNVVFYDANANLSPFLQEANTGNPPVIIGGTRRQSRRLHRRSTRRRATTRRRYRRNNK